MELIDEEDHLALALLDFLEHGLQSLLELAAVLGTRDQRAHVERKETLVLESLGHVAAHNALCKSLDDRRLTDAGFTDQNRVILGLTAQDANRVPNLLVAADDGIQLLIPRALHKVVTVLIQRVVSCLGVIRGDALIAAHRGEGLQELLAADAVRPEELLDGAVRMREHTEEEMLHGDIVVSHGLCLIFRTV